jgi:ribosome-associated protein
VKHTSVPACAQQPDLPAGFCRSRPAPAGVPRASSGTRRQSVATDRDQRERRTDAYPREVPPTSEPIDVPIRDESIRLGQFLKLANLVESGAEAKPVIADGAVRVNDEVETRRGRQLVPGDVVTLGGLAARVATGEVEIDVPW